MNVLRLLRVATLLFSTALLAANRPAPYISTPLVPASVAPGSAGFNLVVNGAGFAAGAVVNWNGSPRTTIIVSHNQVKAQITAADVAVHGTATVTVVNPGPGGGSSNVAYFPIRFSSATAALARRDHPLGSGIAPAGITIGDFNHDGIVDVAVGTVSDTSSAVAVYLGLGNGTFSTAISTPTSVRAVAMQAADFNGDGKLDLMILDGQSNGQVLLGNGDGTLNPLTPIVVTANAEFMAVGDVNGDGILDLITVGEDLGTQNFDVYLGNGDGTFTFKQDVALLLGLGNPALGDFNGDGKLDLAVPDVDVDENNVIDVFLGNGDGTFKNMVSYETSFANLSVVAADVNKDGKLDLISDGVSVLLGNGDGTFTSVGGTSVTNNSASVSIAVVDMNGDGKQDVVVGPRTLPGQSANVIGLLLGNGDGTFQNAITWATGKQLELGLGIADFNRDGKFDVVDINIDALSSASVFSVFLQAPLNVSPTFMDFGVQKKGSTSSSQSVTLTNDSSSALSLTSITIGGANPGDYAKSTTCSTSLAAGASCTLSLTFSPKVTGTRTASVQVSYSGVGGPQYIELTGVGN